MEPSAFFLILYTHLQSINFLFLLGGTRCQVLLSRSALYSSSIALHQLGSFRAYASVCGSPIEDNIPYLTVQYIALDYVYIFAVECEPRVVKAEAVKQHQNLHLNFHENLNFRNFLPQQSSHLGLPQRIPKGTDHLTKLQRQANLLHAATTLLGFRTWGARVDTWRGWTGCMCS
jgi:hypothetical protein